MEIEPGISNDYLPMDPKRLLERLHTALNTGDITNLLHCLQVDFEQVYPAAPSGNTTGLEAARSTWENVFQTYPDFRADLLRQAIEGNMIWTEWHWQGKPNGATSGLDRSGVVIFGVEEGLIAWGPLFYDRCRNSTRAKKLSLAHAKGRIGSLPTQTGKFPTECYGETTV